MIEKPAVLLSIRPEWCYAIEGGGKTVEVRKTKPKLEVPFKCYIYCTKEDFPKIVTDWGKSPFGKVIGEFVCDKISWIDPGDFVVREEALRALQGSCLTIPECKEYAGWGKGMPLCERKGLYGWHISGLKIYDKPMELSCFVGVERPPQSWQYIKEQKTS